MATEVVAPEDGEGSEGRMSCRELTKPATEMVDRDVIDLRFPPIDQRRMCPSQDPARAQRGQHGATFDTEHKQVLASNNRRTSSERISVWQACEGSDPACSADDSFSLRLVLVDTVCQSDGRHGLLLRGRPKTNGPGEVGSIRQPESLGAKNPKAANDPPRVSTRKKSRVIHHTDDIDAPLDELDFSLLLPIPPLPSRLLILQVDALRFVCTVQHIPHSTGHSSTEDQLRLLGDFPESDGLVTSACADGEFGAKRGEGKDAVLVTE